MSRLRLVLPALLAACTACASQDPPPPRHPAPPVPASGRKVRPAIFVEEPRVISGAQRAQIEKHCGKLGMPVVRAAWGRTRLVTRDGYVLEHADFDRLPLWVAEHVRAEQLTPVPKYRRPRWKAEPQLPKGVRAENEDYQGLKDVYDRGHLAPNADFGTKEARDQTFYLSNTVPQDSMNNRRVWERIERQVRAWIEKRGEAFVVSGGFFHDPEEETGAADGRVEYSTIGPNEVAVPTHLYKIVLAPAGGGRWEVIAFVVENRAYPAPFDLPSLVKSVDWIEARTGIDFFPGMLPAAQAELEAQTPAWWAD